MQVIKNMANQQQPMNVQKLKSPLPTSQQQSVLQLAQQQRNATSRLPVPKAQQNQQLANQMAMQRVAQVSHAMTLKVAPQSQVAQRSLPGQVINNQKSLNTNHKNQTVVQLGQNKAQQKVPQTRPGVINNTQKPVVCAAQKTQVVAQQKNIQQQLQHAQQLQQQQRPPMVLQKSQSTLATVTAATRVQSPVCKSSSVPNINKLPNSAAPKQMSPQFTPQLVPKQLMPQQMAPRKVNVMAPLAKGAPQQQMLVRFSNPKPGSPKQVAPTKQVAKNRTASQPVMIIQQNAQKQPGCIKTIPAQKNNLKVQTKGAPLSGQPPLTKGAVKVVPQVSPVYKGQLKVQQTNQKQMPVPMQTQQPAFPSQNKQSVGKVVGVGEKKEQLEIKIEQESQQVKEEEQMAPSPSKRPAYEYLQYILQDHNYVAPPPRTPPPAPAVSPPHPKQSPVNGSSAVPVPTQIPYMYSQEMFISAASNKPVEDDAASNISSDQGREVEPEGEETETAPEGEGDDEDSITRCICDFQHDDGYMICCDRCLVWQHVDCMGIDRANIPDEYLCEKCRPRRVDRQRARQLQMRKREELVNSDSSSDSSSSSSADLESNSVGSASKKRPLQQSRRKSDSQVRRLNNNNNVAKRQRREANSKQGQGAKVKKEPTKRPQAKRKTKRRMSLEVRADEESSQDNWAANSSMTPLRQWIEKYEEAVTNHYSPELRARISSIKVNGTHNDLKQGNVNLVATGKCRLNIQSNSLKFLVATMYLPPNTPIVELRGKYMLSTQHRPSYPQGRQSSQRPGPFVFFYRLPRDGTEVCVDTRTYGNEARFVRRSCKPNAEVKHCVEKGTLHLYIVSSSAIDKNAEITIKHEQHDLLLSPNSSSAQTPVLCACNNPKECQFNAIGQANRKGNGAIDSTDGRERRRRGRRNTVSEEPEPATAPPVVQPQPSPTTAPVAPAVTSPVKKAPVPVAQTPVPTPVRQTNVVKEEAPLSSSPQTSPQHSQPSEDKKKDKKKLTREERKMEAIMKAFERMEKAQQRKQEVQARNAQRKESGGQHSEDERVEVKRGDKSVRRKKRKGRARTTSQSQRRTRLNSADSDLSSGDESPTIRSRSPTTNQNCPPNRDVYSSRLRTPLKESVQNDSGSSQQGIPTAAGLLLALANSSMSGPASPTMQQPASVKSPTCDSGASSSGSQSSTPSTPLSSACLLVAAAVGPLAPGFKFPKTKKVMMNEWLKESPDPTSSQSQTSSPIISKPEETPSGDFYSSTAAKSFATLVQAANTVSNICDSPPQKDKKNAASGSAKKRWLRQAISEECDSPNSRPESPPSTLAPPKKRRFARENLSSDNYTPPTTPTMSGPDGSVHRNSLVEDDFLENLSEESKPAQSFQVKEEELDIKPEVQNLKMEMKVDSSTAAEFKFEGKTETLYSDEEEVPKENFVMEVDVPKEVAKKDEDSMSIDEFDVEAQMMKLTGDDGNDYAKALEPLSERFKNVDGIEGLMESSKEDSESERELEDEEDDKDKEKVKIREEAREVEKEKEREMEKIKELERQKEAEKQRELEQQQEMEKQKEIEREIERIKEMEQEKIDREKTVEIDMFEQFEEKKMCPVEALEELKVMADSTPAESDTCRLEKEEIKKKPFPSIPPLSERIKKKPTAEPSPVKNSQLPIEAAIIESSILENESSQVLEDKSTLSAALRELLETKLVADTVIEEVAPPALTHNQNQNVVSEMETGSTKMVLEEPKDVRVERDEDKKPRVARDPRTVTPKDVPATSAKAEIPPIKRKLSISEYRKRKQQSTGTPPEQETTGDSSNQQEKSRERSGSASSGTSSLSSDDESAKAAQDLPGLSTLPLFANLENSEEKKDVNLVIGEDGTMGWSAAPTLVERQRENLTERLKREFGLFLSDDEEERARKQGLTAEAILKARQTSPTGTPQSLAGVFPGVAQLPPQPYIPPPGSASHLFPQFAKPPIGVASAAYPSFAAPVPPPPPGALYPNCKFRPETPQQRFVVPQAPPGANPYPPAFVPPPPPPLPPPTSAPPVCFTAPPPVPVPPSTATFTALPPPLPPAKSNFFNRS